MNDTQRKEIGLGEYVALGTFALFLIFVFAYNTHAPTWIYLVLIGILILLLLIACIAGYMKNIRPKKIPKDLRPEKLEFHEGLAVCEMKNRKWGYIRKGHKGKFVTCIPGSFDEAKPFSEGLAEVQTENAWGYIDKEGCFAVEPQFSWTHPFKNDRAKVTFKYPKYSLYSRKAGATVEITKIGTQVKLPPLEDRVKYVPTTCERQMCD